MLRLALMSLTILACVARSGQAQTPATVSLDTVLFADNGEFFSPFRTGETILGSWQRLAVDFDLGKPVVLKVGLYTLERDGSTKLSELARPVASLTFGGAHHRFVIGTIETTDATRRMGPDVTTPHGLLPALGVETLWFSRAYEAGAQIRNITDRFTQDVWFDYQRLITAEHRELFDGGVVGQYQPAAAVPLSLAYQWHVVHHGGQQFHNGPVSDSFGYGPGLVIKPALPYETKGALEVYELFSYDRPDRAQPDLTSTGNATFVRLSAERSDWRGHVLAWQGHNFKHEAGDPNYLSVYPDGRTAEGRRDYAEAGLARRFRPTPAADLEVSGRAHLVQGKWGYSYRVMAIVHVPIWSGAKRTAPPVPPADAP